jgi:hypothetical protein
MEEKIPLLKRFDAFVFAKLDEFRKTPGHQKMLEGYAGLDEDQQKFAKWGMLLTIFLLPLTIVGVVWWQNLSLDKELASRIALVESMQKIIAQSGEIGGLTNSIASPNALTSDSDLTSRLSSVLGSSGIDVSKIQVSNFASDSVTKDLTRSEADFRFQGLSTEQLVSVFTALLQRERFRISAVEITRNAENNTLDGNFHGIHFGAVQPESFE